MRKPGAGEHADGAALPQGHARCEGTCLHSRPGTRMTRAQDDQYDSFSRRGNGVAACPEWITGAPGLPANTGLARCSLAVRASLEVQSVIISVAIWNVKHQDVGRVSSGPVFFTMKLTRHVSGLKEPGAQVSPWCSVPTAARAVVPQKHVVRTARARGGWTRPSAPTSCRHRRRSGTCSPSRDKDPDDVH